MDQSRRAVESYWRSRMIDGATSDEDKITPVYKLEEICELLRSSHVGIVKEVSEFILKRLQHKSPVVKQKALRIIKYAVGKSGAEFRREMQRNSVAVRELIHYKGQPDPLKGDSLNKAVRETAQEALSALFANEESKASKAPVTENLGSRIQGFGNTNFDFVAEDKKSSFLSEVVNIGSATIKQGLNTLTQSPSLKKNDTGTYRGPNLRRSLTTETDYTEQYEGVGGSYGDTQSSSRFSKNASSGPSGNWGAPVQHETNEDSQSNYGERTREERLLETIVTSGGVRLQPSRDALHIFLQEASKLDALVLSHALDLKLKSPSWQIRMKAMCVLEALLRKKDDEHFAVVAVYFSENKDLIEKCSESPQASLREKAIKVLSLLNGEQNVDGAGKQEQKVKAEAINVQMPNLIDTGDSDNLFEIDEHTAKLNNQSSGDPSTSSSPLIDDLLGGGLSSGSTMHDPSNDDPFADVSFHNGSKEEQEADIFSGMMVDKPGASEPQVAGSKSGPELFDIFGPSSEPSKDQNAYKGDVNDIMAGLSINEAKTPAKQNGTFVTQGSGSLFSESSINPVHQVPSNSLNSAFAPQISGSSTNPIFPSVDMQYNAQPGFIYNPSLVAQPINYNAMASLLAQQQFLATMSNYQHLGNLQSNVAAIHSAVSKGEYASPLPDIFNPSLSSQPPTSLMSSSKKEETKAFDFISDHIAAARDPKRVT